METIQALGAAHRALRHRRDEADRNLRALCSNLAREVAGAHDELFIDGDDPELFDEELIDMAAEWLLAPGDSDSLPTEVLHLVNEVRQASLPEFDRLLADARLAQQNTIGPVEDFADALRTWLSEAKAEATIAAEWPEVLAKWRSALNLTVREAAAALQVSASAITRYESGARSPSLPQLTALVEAMGTWDPVEEESELRRSGRRLADQVGWDPESFAQRIDEADAERHQLQGLLEDIARDQFFSAERLRTLVALAQNPEALDHVRSLAGFDLTPSLQQPTSPVPERPADEASGE
jgi:transcriptional regulator with XRE-family HTH domain